MAVCDLDGLEQVNDTWGHQPGDMVLVGVADRLRHQPRPGDHLARLGGEESTVLARNVVDVEAAMHVGGRLLDAMRDPFAEEGTVLLGLSVGTALSTPGTGAITVLSWRRGPVRPQARRRQRDPSGGLSLGRRRPLRRQAYASAGRRSRPGRAWPRTAQCASPGRQAAWHR